MTSGSYLSILVRNTRVGISAQHHAESNSHALVDTVRLHVHEAAQHAEQNGKKKCAMKAVVFHAIGLAMTAHMPLAARAHVKTSDTESFLLTSLTCKVPHLSQSLHV